LSQREPLLPAELWHAVEAGGGRRARGEAEPQQRQEPDSAQHAHGYPAFQPQHWRPRAAKRAILSAVKSPKAQARQRIAPALLR
jgi:hypothetical protein